MNVWFLSERQFISPSSASMRVTLDVCRPLFESFEFVLICNWERMRSRRPTNTFYTTPAGVSTRFLSVEFTYFTFGENLSPVRIKNYTQQLASCGPKSPRWLAKGGSNQHGPLLSIANQTIYYVRILQPREEISFEVFSLFTWTRSALGKRILNRRHSNWSQSAQLTNCSQAAHCRKLLELPNRSSKLLSGSDATGPRNNGWIIE